MLDAFQQLVSYLDKTSVIPMHYHILDLKPGSESQMITEHTVLLVPAVASQILLLIILITGSALLVVTYVYYFSLKRPHFLMSK